MGYGLHGPSRWWRWSRRQQSFGLFSTTMGRATKAGVISGMFPTLPHVLGFPSHPAWGCGGQASAKGLWKGSGAGRARPGTAARGQTPPPPDQRPCDPPAPRRAHRSAGAPRGEAQRGGGEPWDALGCGAEPGYFMNGPI